MQPVHRLLTLVLACLVLMWAGAASAQDACESASELVEQGQGRYGVAAVAAGGGQGTAMVVQACH